MILKIDSTNSENILVELEDIKSKFKKSVSAQNEKGSQVLLPLIVKILKDNKKSFEDLDEIKVNTGPGSFTGTRVGVAIANALSFALDLPLNGKKGTIAQVKYTKTKFD